MKPRKRGLEVIELDSLRDIQRMRGWTLIQERVLKTRKQLVDELCQQIPELQSAKLRGQIEMCDVMLKIPSILVAEGTSTKTRRDQEQ